MHGREGKYYVLKNPTPKTYYRLSERDFSLWERMDGTHTVKDLVVAYFMHFGSFAFARVVSLVEGLKANLFLTDQPANIYQQIRQRLAARSLSYRLNQVAEVLNVAAILLVVTAALALGSSHFRFPIPPTRGDIRGVVIMAGLAVAAILAWQTAANYAGSRLARPFGLLGLFLLALLLKEAATTAATWQLLRVDGLQLPLLVLRLLAYSALLLAALALFANTDLQALQLAEKALLALGLAATGWATASIAQRPGPALLANLSSTCLPLLALTLLVPTVFSFWHTWSGPAWALFLLALGLLMATNWLQQPPLVPSLLLASSLLLQRVAYVQTRYRVAEVETAVEMPDHLRLQRAFGWTVDGILAQLREMAGERNSRLLQERYNRYALAAGWKLTLVHGHLSDTLPADVGAIERGQVYAAALNPLLDLVAHEIGERLAVRALQRVYDHLP